MSKSAYSAEIRSSFGTTGNKKYAILTAELIRCMTEFKEENNLIDSTGKVDDFPKQDTNVLSYIINENRFCFHQFLNIFFKATPIFSKWSLIIQ
jgi:hypothetical protein